MFESGAACNYQVQYVRDRHALPITRDYMAEAEKKLRLKPNGLREKKPARKRGAPSSPSKETEPA
jgi:cyclopropane-fatty-acyl-phospholipid synthase